MLQQTTVAAVRGRYGAFLARFPDLPSLAQARQSSVLAAWSGLGYYARARHLHAAARVLVARHGGRLPDDPATLETLPGFGRYMAAAVASLAFGARVPAVDANVTRVVSRLFAINGVSGTAAHAAAVRFRAGALLPARRPGDLTAALMDLGQQICLPRRPDCASCPVSGLCAAFTTGTPTRFPGRRTKPRPHRVHVAAAVAVKEGRVLLRRESVALLHGLWLFPAAEGSSPAAARTALAHTLPALGLRLAEVRAVATARHTIVNRVLDIRVYRAVERAGHDRTRERGPAAARWLTPGALARSAIPTLTRRIASAALEGFPGRSVTLLRASKRAF